MARPEKFGHDYFSFYTRSDESNHEDLLTMISHTGGYEGYVAILELDCLIRGATPDSNGYYIIMDQRNSNKLATITKLTIKKLEMIIEKALEIGHYDRDMYDKFGILTSKRIQEDHINTSVKRNNLLIRREYMLLSSKDIRELGIKRKLACIEDFYIWKDTQIEVINSIENDENEVFIDSNNEVSFSNNSVSSRNNEVSSSKSTQIKINKIKENKIKENEKKLNSESNSNCNGNCNSKEEDKPLIDYSKLHIFLQSLLKKELFPEDPIDIYSLNEFLFELQQDTSEGGYGYSFKDVMKAGRVIMRTLKNKSQEEFEDIEDIFEYITRAMLSEISKGKPVPIQSDSKKKVIANIEETPNEDNHSDELEQMKIARCMKQYNCNEDEAIKILVHDRESRKNIKIGDDLDE